MKIQLGRIYGRKCVNQDKGKNVTLVGTCISADVAYLLLRQQQGNRSAAETWRKKEKVVH